MPASSPFLSRLASVLLPTCLAAIRRQSREIIANSERSGVWDCRRHESCRTMPNGLAIRKKKSSSSVSNARILAGTCRGSTAVSAGRFAEPPVFAGAEAALAALSLSARRKSTRTPLLLSRGMRIRAMSPTTQNLRTQQSSFRRVHSSAAANSAFGRQSIRRPAFPGHAARRAGAPSEANDQYRRRPDVIE
jgi:hypothetical protein